jgi:hypothetical protein
MPKTALAMQASYSACAAGISRPQLPLRSAAGPRGSGFSAEPLTCTGRGTQNDSLDRPISCY